MEYLYCRISPRDQVLGLYLQHTRYRIDTTSQHPLENLPSKTFAAFPSIFLEPNQQLEFHHGIPPRSPKFCSVDSMDHTFCKIKEEPSMSLRLNTVFLC